MRLRTRTVPLVIGLPVTNHKNRPLGYPLVTLPLVTLVMLETNRHTASKGTQLNENNLSDLIRLNELKERGILTEAEFNAKKSRLLKYL